MSPSLLSLWQIMQQYKLHDFVLMYSTLLTCDRDLLNADAINREISPPEGAFEALALAVDGAAIMSVIFDADPSLVQQMHSLKKILRDKTADRRACVLHARLKPILDGIQNNLESRMFMFVPAQDVTYWDNPELFGKEFLIVFHGEALMEMREAGNCFVANRGTACVFHCMRVAEHGLRRLARKLNVSLTDKGKRHPLEYGDWDKVISQIRNRIAETRKLPRGSKKEDSLQFYSNAADHCEYMKDIWRNEVSHTRRVYNREETLAVLTRVRDFVQLLAKRDLIREVRKQATIGKQK